jgi:hypothetical protein
MAQDTVAHVKIVVGPPETQLNLKTTVQNDVALFEILTLKGSLPR